MTPRAGMHHATFLGALGVASLLLFGLLWSTAEAVPSSITVPAATFVNGQNVAVGAAACGNGGFGATVLLNAPPCFPINQVAEFVFTAEAGSYRLFSEYAAGDSRPMRIKINSVLVREGLGSTTGCYLESCQQWFFEGLVTLVGGQNVMRIERDNDPMPHVRTFRLDPALATPAFRNPLAGALVNSQGYGGIDAATILNADIPLAMSADGVSAVVVAIQSPRASTPVTFQSSYGTLTEFKSNYLVETKRGQTSSVQVPSESQCIGGLCTYLALLWPPDKMPAGSGNPPNLTITVTATQAGLSTAAAYITLQPPPVLLVHGIWSSAKASGFARGAGGLSDWLASQYPHDQIKPIDYGAVSYRSFGDPDIQTTFHVGLSELLKAAAVAHVVARQVDVVGHSMGGLVTRYFVSNPPAQPLVPPNPVHKLVTIGTPHLGSPLATLMNDLRGSLAGGGSESEQVKQTCLAQGINLCTFDAITSLAKKRVDTGVKSLIPQSLELRSLKPMEYDALIGTRPQSSSTYNRLNLLVRSFRPFTSLDVELDPNTTLHDQHDTIVSAVSQIGDTKARFSVVPNLVHTDIYDGDTGETESREVWRQTFSWLTEQQAPLIAAKAKASTQIQAGSDPVFDLTGYTLASPSSVTYTPSTNTALTVNSLTNIVATSSSKTISQVLLFQSATDPADKDFLFANIAPFSVPFTPTRLGTVKFVAFTLFSDMTYSVTLLTYSLQTSGSPTALNLIGIPSTLRPGMTTRFNTVAVFPTGSVDVTQAATYVVRSATTSVFGASADGAISANAPGNDFVDVSYGGRVASAKITVVAPPPNRLDVDDNGVYDALTDGVILVRYLLGITGNPLVSGALGPNAKRTDPTALLNHLNSIRTAFDVDGDGLVNARSDGLLLARYLLGFRGSALLSGAVGVGSTRTTDQIEGKIQLLMP